MSTLNEMNLTEARAQLVLAESAVEQQRREDAQGEVRRILARVALLKPEVEMLLIQGRLASDQKVECIGKLADARSQIARWQALLDDPLAVPDEQKQTFQRTQLRRWRNRETKLLTRLADAVQREAMLRPAFEGKAVLDSLGYQLSNYAAVAEGRNPGSPPLAGGLQRVSGDFLHIGSDQRVHRISDMLMEIPVEE